MKYLVPPACVCVCVYVCKWVGVFVRCLCLLVCASAQRAQHWRDTHLNNWEFYQVNSLKHTINHVRTRALRHTCVGATERRILWWLESGLMVTCSASRLTPWVGCTCITYHLNCSVSGSVVQTGTSKRNALCFCKHRDCKTVQFESPCSLENKSQVQALSICMCTELIWVNFL